LALSQPGIRFLRSRNNRSIDYLDRSTSRARSRSFGTAPAFFECANERLLSVASPDSSDNHPTFFGNHPIYAIADPPHNPKAIRPEIDRRNLRIRRFSPAGMNPRQEMVISSALVRISDGKDR
jgi:hypothetical protein